MNIKLAYFKLSRYKTAFEQLSVSEWNIYKKTNNDLNV